MNLKSKVKSYSFWISLVSALLIVVRIVGEHFDWFINEGFIMDIVTAVCGVLVLLGILSAPSSSEKSQTNLEELEQQSKEIQNKQKETNSQIKEDIMAEQLTIQQQIEMLKKSLNTDKLLEQESGEGQEESTKSNEQIEVEEISKDIKQIEAEIQDVQMCTLQNDTSTQISNTEENFGLEIVTQSLDSEIIADNAKMATNEVLQATQDIYTCASEQMDLGVIENSKTCNLTENADYNTTIIEDTQKYEKVQCDENIETEIEAGDISSESDVLISMQNNENLLDDVLSNLDKSQLKNLLIEILMRL